jgi:hypothetical protein
MRMIKFLALSMLLVPLANPSYGLHVIGWQTFENAGASNESGIADNTPDPNSTFDATPVGSNNGGRYLSGAIGPDASNSGWDGFGQSTDGGFLNGFTFGSNTIPPGLRITDWTLADGSPGERIGPFGEAGTSSWKFSSQNSPNQLLGDFSVTNESDYSFRLEHIHFDARALGAATSADTLEVRYLATPGNLINAATGTEVLDQRVFYNNVWSSTGVENVSQSVATVIDSAARLAPGDKATFRFEWSRTNTPSGGGQTQIDNVAFSGTFLDQNNGFAEIDPRTVGDVLVDGDFDNNGFYECSDIDDLVATIFAGSDDASFDLTSDGFVNGDDLTAWLAEAGSTGGLTASGNPVQLGDANLDGAVNGQDFVAWNSHKFTPTAAWCSGDFNADGNVDGQDFVIWNNNKFTTADNLSVVPEPASAAILADVSLLLLFWRRRRLR